MYCSFIRYLPLFQSWIKQLLTDFFSLIRICWITKFIYKYIENMLKQTKKYLEFLLKIYFSVWLWFFSQNVFKRNLVNLNFSWRLDIKLYQDQTDPMYSVSASSTLYLFVWFRDRWHLSINIGKQSLRKCSRTQSHVK